MSHSDPGVRSADQSEEVGPWDPALAQLRAWDRDWAETCEKMTTNPWIGGVLPRKFIELVSVGLNAACTNLNPDGTRRHIRAALEGGSNARRNSVRPQMRLGHVDPFLQPGRADSAGGSEGGRREARPERRGANPGVRQDEGHGPVESGVGPVR